MFTFRMMCVTVLLFCLVGQTLAATSDWVAVQRLVAGDRVEVRLSTGKTTAGAIDHVTADAVYLQTQTGAISRDEIRQLYVKRRGNRGRRVLIGAGVGAAAAAVAAPRIMEHETGYGGAVAGTVVFGAVVGAVVGLLVRGSGKSLLYESSPSR